MTRFLAVLAVAALSAAPAVLAQTEPAAPAAARIASTEALKHIPDGCMGFVLVNNITDLTTAADAFIQAISPPGQPLLPMSVLDALLQKALLGDGFNPNGPFAVAMLDPQQYGVDLIAAIRPDADAETRSKAMENLPIVLLLPGQNPERMLAAHEPVADGDFMRTEGGTCWKQVGPFVAGCGNKKAIEAIENVARPVSLRLTSAEKETISRNEVSLWIDMRVAGPILQAAMKQLEQTMKEAAAGPPGSSRPSGPSADPMESMRQVFAMYSLFIDQARSVTMGLRLPKEGLVGEMRVGFLPESLMGKSLAAVRQAGGPQLNRLPDMTCVLAMGFRSVNTMPSELGMEMFTQMVDTGLMGKMSDETKARWGKVVDVLNKEVRAVQFGAGGVAGKPGQMALAYVLECDSAEKLRPALAEYIGLVCEVYRSMPNPDLSKLALTYSEGVEEVDGKKVDAILIDHPEIASMRDEDRAKLKSILGSDVLRILVADADAKTVVLTFGGGTEFLAQAMKSAAAGQGKLAADPGVAKALAMLPKDRMGEVILHVGNIFKVVADISAALDEQALPFTVDAPIPLTGSLSVENSDLCMTGFAPSETIRGLMTSLMPMIMQMMMGQQAQPMPGP